MRFDCGFGLAHMIRSACHIWIMALVGTAGACIAQPTLSQRAPNRGFTIIQTTCLQCHGTLKTSGLDLRTRAGALTGGVHGKDLVPGKAELSSMYRRIAGMDKPQRPATRRMSH